MAEVAASNVETHRAWDGEHGAFWAEQEARFDESVAGYQRRFLESAAIKPDEHVLDIGCGNGQTTRDAAKLARSALGVDLSAQMIEVARRRAVEQGIDNATFLQADAQIHPFPPAHFAVAISRMGSMFFGEPVVAFTNIGRALVPGGRLTLLVWQAEEHNEWLGTLSRVLAAGRRMPVPPAGAPGPTSLADPDLAARTLGEAGFSDVTFEDVREPTYFGADADEAYRFIRGMGFVKRTLSELDAAAGARALDDLRASIAAHAASDGVRYGSACWIVTAKMR